MSSIRSGSSRLTSGRIGIANLPLAISNVSCEYDTIPGETWIEKLKYTFDEVDKNHDNIISIEQWMRSRLRFVVSTERFNDDRFREYFVEIDSNGDDMISWHELVDFLMCQQKGINADSFDKNLRLVHVAPDLMTARAFHRTKRCLRIMFVSYVDCIATLTENSLTFWSLVDCKPVKHYTDGDEFVDFCYLRTMLKLAIVKANRTIIFYDLKTNTKIPFIISASLDARIIPTLSLKEAQEEKAKTRKKNPPLFHISTSIACDYKDSSIIYVGNQEGQIEIFKFSSSRMSKYDWEANRIKLETVHDTDVTQISYLPYFSVMASCSKDGSIALWQFDEKTLVFSVLYTFYQPMNFPINSFVFDERTRCIIYTTAAHYFGSWRCFTQKHVQKETPTQMISCIANIPISEDASFIVTVSCNNFFSTYTPPNLELIKNWYMEFQHELCPPTGALCISGHLFLCGSYMSCWRCESAETEGLNPHQHNLTGALANDIFSRVISCDEAADIISWDYRTGAKSFYFSLKEEDSIVTCIQSDIALRRLAIGYSNGCVKIVSANFGSILVEIDKTLVDGGCGYVAFAHVTNQKYIVCVNGRQAFILFDDLPGNRVRFFRAYVGHNEQISSVVSLKKMFILSIGMGEEMFLWIPKSQNPIMKFHLPEKPTVACDIYSSKTDFLVADIAGKIQIMSVEEKSPLKTLFPLELIIVSPISAMNFSSKDSYLFIGNTLGYLQFLQFSNDEIRQVQLYRAHDGPIDQISFSEKFHFVVTSGRDQQIRLWSMKPDKYIGELGKYKKWDITNAKTWESEPHDIDPEHFHKEEEEVEEVLPPSSFDTSSDDERVVLSHSSSAYQPITIPKFTFESLENITEEIENTCITGRNREKLVAKVTKVRPSSTIQKGQTLMTYEDFIPNQDLSRTDKALTRLSNLKAMRHPFRPPSPRRVVRK